MKIICDYHGGESCDIWVQSGEISFPFTSWDDFGLYIISDWVDVFVKSFYSEETTFKLFFMEGPYFLLCQKQDHHLLIRGIDEHDDDGMIVFEELCKTDDFILQLLQVAKKIVQYPNSEEKMKRYLLGLERSLEDLKYK